MTAGTPPTPQLQTPAWFDVSSRTAYTPIPDDIRKAAKRICAQHNLQVIHDPLDIAKLIAMHTERGNGSGSFKDGRPVHIYRTVPIERAAENIAFQIPKGLMRQALLEQLH